MRSAMQAPKGTAGAGFSPERPLPRSSLDQLTVARNTSVLAVPAAIEAIVPDTFGAA